MEQHSHGRILSHLAESARLINEHLGQHRKEVEAAQSPEPPEDFGDIQLGDTVVAVAGVVTGLWQVRAIWAGKLWLWKHSRVDCVAKRCDCQTIFRPPLVPGQLVRHARNLMTGRVRQNEEGNHIVTVRYFSDDAYRALRGDLTPLTLPETSNDNSQ